MGTNKNGNKKKNSTKSFFNKVRELNDDHRIIFKLGNYRHTWDFLIRRDHVSVVCNYFWHLKIKNKSSELINGYNQCSVRKNELDISLPYLSLFLYKSNVHFHT